MKAQKELNNDQIIILDEAQYKLENNELFVNIQKLNSKIKAINNKLYFQFNNKSVVLEGDKIDLDLRRIDKFLAKQNGVSLEGPGTIYLVSDGHNTKIGATTYNTTKRLNELQVGNAKKLTLIGEYRVERRIATESMIHDYYEEKNIRGEWFILSDCDIVKILNDRPQSSNNNEYQVLTTKIAGEIGASLFRIIFIETLYKVKILARLKRNLGINDLESETNLFIQKLTRNDSKVRFL